MSSETLCPAFIQQVQFSVGNNQTSISKNDRFSFCVLNAVN